MFNNGRPYSKYVLDAVAAIKQHINSNPFQYRTAGALLENVSAPNRSLVERAFKQVHGTGIKEYLVRQRLEVSKLLLETGMTKKQVAHKCHYSTQASYCRAFKKEFNITPTDFLNEYT